MKRFSWFDLVLGALVLAALGYAGFRFLSAEDLALAFGRFDYSFLSYIVLLSLVYTVLKGARLVYLLRSVLPVPLWVGLRAYFAGEPLALLPGGFAARVGPLQQAGIPIAQSSVPVLVASLLDQVFLLLGSLLAALWLQEARAAVAVIAVVLGVAGILLVIPGVRAWLDQRLEGLAQRFRLQKKWQTIKHTALAVANWRVLLLGFGLTVLAFGLKLWALQLCLLALGWNLAPGPLFLAFVLPTLLGRVVPIPGGVGVTEAGMVGFLTIHSEIPAEEALAASTLFRFATVLFPALLGALIYLFGWHRNPLPASMRKT